MDMKPESTDQEKSLYKQVKVDGVDEKPRYVGLDVDRSMPDVWYVRMMLKRLMWDKCEDRETVISIFKVFWPNLALRAEEFYELALTVLENRGNP